MECETLLVCIGRRPYTDKLGLDTVNVQVDNKGRIPTNERFQTSAPK